MCQSHKPCIWEGIVLLHSWKPLPTLHCPPTNSKFIILLNIWIPNWYKPCLSQNTPICVLATMYLDDLLSSSHHYGQPPAGCNIGCWEGFGGGREDGCGSSTGIVSAGRKMPGVSVLTAPPNFWIHASGHGRQPSVEERKWQLKAEFAGCIGGTDNGHWGFTQGIWDNIEELIRFSCEMEGTYEESMSWSPSFPTFS